MDASYEPDIYDFTTPAAILGDLEWYRRKAQECGGSILELGAGTGRVAIVLALYAADIRRLLERAGFGSIVITGGFDDRPLAKDTDELVVEATVA